MSKWLVERGTAVLEKRTSRRGFLVKGAVAGSALAVAPWQYLLRPGTAYAAVSCVGGCSGGACCDGYTEFCCVVNNGNNSCPPGTFEGGWWRADGSNFCAGGSRYYTDCNAFGGSCGCRCADGDCNRRRTCCNVFRYGQCHQEIGGIGAISCRVVTCTPPYQLFPCTTDLKLDNSTANHTAACKTPPPAHVPPGFQIQAGHDAMALDVAGSSHENGAPIIQWPVSGAANQRWLLSPVGGDTYAIVSQESGLVLDVAGASTAPGTKVIQWPWTGNANQRWRLEGVAPNVAVVVAVHSDQALDVASSSRTPGSGVIQWPRTGGANQRWLFTYIS